MVLLAGLSALGALATNIIFPAFPQIADNLSVSSRDRPHSSYLRHPCLERSAGVPDAHLEAPDPAGEGIDFVALRARPLDTDFAISNGFGFGGVNASKIFRRWMQ